MRITRRDFLKVAGLAGAVLFLPPGVLALEDPKKFNPNHEYGRGIEYGDAESREFAIKMAKRIAERVLPKGTLYILVNNPDVYQQYGRIKAICWLYSPHLEEQFKATLVAGPWKERPQGTFHPETGQWIIGYFRA